MSDDVFPIRHEKYFWEKCQDSSNECLHAISTGDRKPHVVSLDDDKKYASFSNIDNIRSYEVLKLVMNPNFHKRTIGHTSVFPCTHLAYGIA